MLGELDGGHALLFPSGAGATTAVVLALLEPGDTVALAAGRLLRHRASRSGCSSGGACDAVEFDQTGPAAGRRRTSSGSRRPSNPFLTFPDLAATPRRRTRPARACSWTRPPRRRCCCGRSSTAPTSSCTARRSTSPATHDALLGAVDLPRRGRRATACWPSGTRAGSSPRPTRPGSCCAGLKTLQPARPPPVGDGARARAAASQAHPAVLDRPLPGPRRPRRRALPRGRLRRPALVRRRGRRRRARRRDLDCA